MWDSTTDIGINGDMAMSTKVYCGECKWWDNPGGGTHYPCRRHSPTVISKERIDNPCGPSGPSVVTEWPITISMDWCGEGEYSDTKKEADSLEDIRFGHEAMVVQREAKAEMERLKPKKQVWVVRFAGWLFRRGY